MSSVAFLSPAKKNTDAAWVLRLVRDVSEHSSCFDFSSLPPLGRGGFIFRWDNAGGCTVRISAGRKGSPRGHCSVGVELCPRI